MAQLFGKGAGEGIAHHRLDERAALGRTAQVAPRLQNGQRLAQNPPAYAQLIGQLGFRRQPCAHGKLAALHGLRKLLRNPVGQALILNGVEVHHEKLCLLTLVFRLTPVKWPRPSAGRQPRGYPCPW